MGVFCSTMGITSANDDEDVKEDIDNLDEALVFDKTNVVGRLPSTDARYADQKSLDWISLAVDLDEASTLVPVAKHDIPRLAANAVSPMHPGAHGNGIASAVAMLSSKKESEGNGRGVGVGKDSRDDRNDRQEEKPTQMKKKFGLRTLYQWMTITAKACFSYGKDAKIDAINSEIDEQIKAAFLTVSKEKTVTDISSVDIKKLGPLLQEISGGPRKTSKPELEMLVKLFDPDGHNTLSPDSFAAGLMLLKDDPSLNRLLGQGLSRLLDHRSMCKVRPYSKYKCLLLTHNLTAPPLVSKALPDANISSLHYNCVRLNSPNYPYNGVCYRNISIRCTVFCMIRRYRKESSSKLASDASAFAIHPNNPRLRLFNRLVLFVGVFYLFEVPVRITFRVGHRLGPWYLAAVGLFDLVLVIDVLVNFCIAYVNKKSVLTYDMKRISRHYLKTTFSMDVVAAFPFDLLAMMTTSRREYIDFTLIAWVRIPKLLRLYRVHQASKTGSADLKSDSIGGVLKRLIPMLMLINHLAACLLWWVSADTYIDHSTNDTMFLRWSGLGTEDIMNLETPAPNEVISVLKQ